MKLSCSVFHFLTVCVFNNCLKRLESNVYLLQWLACLASPCAGCVWLVAIRQKRKYLRFVLNSPLNFAKIILENTKANLYATITLQSAKAVSV